MTKQRPTVQPAATQSTESGTANTAKSSRRRYHSPLREQQAAATRERIIAAGAQLVHGLGDWDWKNLTVRAVAEVAAVSERTVHRHFATERSLRDSILQKLVEESGVDLTAIELDNFADNTARLLHYLSSFAGTPTTVEDPSLVAIDQQRCNALLDAVRRATPEWTEHDRETAAAVLDIAWNPQPYERLLAAWNFDSVRAVDAVTWLIGLVEEAIRQGRRPPAKAATDSADNNPDDPFNGGSDRAVAD